MSQKFPLDEFDSAVSHGGRHRVRRTPKIRALEFLRIVVVALVVAVVGYFGLKFVDSANLFSTAEPVPTISVTDIAKGLEITVLDATTEGGTADRVAATLVDGGFNVVSAGQLGGDSSSNTEIEQTIVFFFNSDDKAAAAVIAKTLGAYPVKQSTAYAGDVTVVIGADFK
jgi:hypothetical protein